MALAKNSGITKRTNYERKLDSLTTIFSANSTCAAVLLIPNEIIVGFNDDALQNSAQMLNEFFRILLSESTEKEEALLAISYRIFYQKQARYSCAFSSKNAKRYD